MTKANHIPGPWLVTDDVYNGDEIGIEVDSGAVIAGAWPFGEDEGGKAIQLANARLIAAAPELLEACKAVLAAIEVPGMFTDTCWIRPPYQFDGVHETACERLAAVIAKAEGTEA